MAKRGQHKRFRVVEPRSSIDLIHIVDANRDVVALVTAGRRADAHLLAAAPEMFDRLVEVRHLKGRHDGGRTRLLLPPEAVAAIDRVLAHAKGRS